MRSEKANDEEGGGGSGISEHDPRSGCCNSVHKEVEAEARATMEAMSLHHSQIRKGMCHSRQDALAYRRRHSFQHDDLPCFFRRR